MLAAVLPPLTVVAIATQDLLSARDRAGDAAAGAGVRRRSSAWPPATAPSRSGGRWPRCPATSSTSCAGCPRWWPTAGRAPSPRTIRAVTDRYRRATLDTLRLAFASSAVLELVATLSVALVAVTVGVRLAAGDLTWARRWWCCCWRRRRTGRCAGSARSSTPRPRASPTFEKVDDARSTSRRDADRAGPVRRRRAGPGVTRSDRACYPGRTTPALAAPRLARARARASRSLTGPSGCGKSTLLAVLAGLSRADRRVGAPGGGTAPAADAGGPRSPGCLSARCSWPASVADNLRLGRPDATDDELWQALRRVALAERVRSLPGGARRRRSARTARALSAGERARLALARVGARATARGCSWTSPPPTSTT